ncbi:hypothetical protein [Pseudogracilibacillus sp. ICA-222130]|uniref:hypothetical protein n=1 Tax=Pseudogracilibacillus sp. ICA-222130 TaxID=3134655 RepID=UPI0030BDFE4D
MAKFDRFVIENLNMLFKRDYLSEEEVEFLVAIQYTIDENINAIMNKRTNSFYNVLELSTENNCSVTKIKEVLNSLQKKGIIYELVNWIPIEKKNEDERKRALFINPEVFFSKSENDINLILASTVKKNDIIEQNNIKLPFKIVIERGSAKLYRKLNFKWIN